MWTWRMTEPFIFTRTESNSGPSITAVLHVPLIPVRWSLSATVLTKWAGVSVSIAACVNEISDSVEYQPLSSPRRDKQIWMIYFQPLSIGSCLFYDWLVLLCPFGATGFYCLCKQRVVKLLQSTAMLWAEFVLVCVCVWAQWYGDNPGSMRDHFRCATLTSDIWELCQAAVKSFILFILL